ncbi:hypothetical protein SAY86_022240 [Trapa natans]|uniref:Uncharacterized protein n=1 Tax=Trapa natans TaxID=22666 RepID=A0AAN7RME7_TRANT|nr:hypothetical protein SAY86_022240 [Trapa natans]
MDGLRLGIDEGGGMEDNPVAAIILPGLTIVRNTGSLLKHLPSEKASTLQKDQFHTHPSIVTTERSYFLIHDQSLFFHAPT